MNAQEWMWLDARRAVEAGELARMCGLTLQEVAELVDYGALEPLQDGTFRADLVAPLRQALQVRVRFDLDLFTAGLLAGHLHRIEALERELRALRAHATREPPGRDGPARWREPHAGERCGCCGPRRGA